MHLAVENIALLMEIVDKEFLIHCFPSLSNGLFKLLLQEFKCSSKTVQAAIAAIHTAYRRIFVYEENYSLQIFAKNHSVRQPVVSEKTGFVDLLTVRKNMNAIAKDEENKQLKDGIVKKNELEVTLSPQYFTELTYPLVLSKSASEFVLLLANSSKICA